MNKTDIIRKIEIHIETTEECLDNFNLSDSVKAIIQQDINFLTTLKSQIQELKTVEE